MLGGIDNCDEGDIIVDGKKVSSLAESQMIQYRRMDIGFVFQFYNLIPNLTASENVELASQICRSDLDSVDVLSSVGLHERVNNFPSQLSGGEQQRVAIARALAKSPKLLLYVLITHNSAIAPMANRVIHMRNGSVASIDGHLLSFACFLQ